MSSSALLESCSTYASNSKSRLQSLYSDVSRRKHSNPTAYHAHVDWWHRTFEELVSSGWQGDSTSSQNGQAAYTQDTTTQSNKLVFGARRAIVDKLRYDGVGKPLGLASTIAELRHTNALIPLSQFLTSTKSVNEDGWLPYRIASFVIGKPLWWAMEQLDIVRSEDSYSEAEMWKMMEGDYVLLGLVERAADAVEASRGGMSLSDRLYTAETFRRDFGSKVLPSVSLSETDIKVLLRYLERDRRVIVQDKDVIKFIVTESDREVTAVDRGILELKTAVSNLQDQVDTMHRKMDETTKRISTALQRQQKSIALAHLRFKKQLEDVLAKRLGALQNLESTLMTVETAAGDVELMKTYEKSTATLRAILSHPSLQRDKIDETMDALAAANESAREIDEAIRIGGDVAIPGAGVDDVELENELNVLVKEVEREKSQVEGASLDRLRETRTPAQVPADESQVRSKLPVAV